MNIKENVLDGDEVKYIVTVIEDSIISLQMSLNTQYQSLKISSYQNLPNFTKFYQIPASVPALYNSISFHIEQNIKIALIILA